jgi:hypothetical protein
MLNVREKTNSRPFKDVKFLSTFLAVVRFSEVKISVCLLSRAFSKIKIAVTRKDYSRGTA